MVGYSQLLAQDFIVFGQVFNANDGTPIEAANVWFKGTSIGTTTNAEGYFFFRNADYHKKLCVSVLGYKKREITLQKRDEVLQIFLQEESRLLDELVVLPGENEALPILERVRTNRNKNNPDKKLNFSTLATDEQKFYINNIRTKHLQRKLFRELTSATLGQADSLYQLPLFYSKKIEKITQFSADSIEKNVIDVTSKSLEILADDQLKTFLENQLPKVNFYQNLIPVLQRNFISPIANQGTIYYKYYLVDSTKTDSGKHYQIRFYPKNDKELAFKGTMWVDSASAALTKIVATMPHTANINFLTDLKIEQTFEKFDETDYFYTQRSAALAFQFDLVPQKSSSRVAVVLTQNENFSQTQTLNSDSTKNVAKVENLPISSDFLNAIDSLNQTKIQKIAYGLVNFMMYGYMHAWKLDIGPLVNVVRYNKLEGFRPTISLRTGEKMMKNFTIGGFVGYGFGDKRWKYGGEFKARFGQNRNTISLAYSNDVLRYGYENSGLVNDNLSNGSENIFTTLSRAMNYTNLAENHVATLAYRYEKEGFRLTAAVEGREILSNKFVPFYQNGNEISAVRTLSGKVGLRISFKEKSLDGFFKRYYLRTSYPVINFSGEYGAYVAGERSEQFGKLNLAVKQTFPTFLGRLKYTIEGGLVLGDVPFYLLEMARGSRGLWFPENDFSLINSTEFVSDAFISGHFRYCTNGLIFNYIPGIKKLNLREELIFKIAYGTLAGNHTQVLTLPNEFKTLEMPYMEFGFGINNIFKLFSLQSIWRLTHRNEPNAINWGLQLLFDIDF